MISAVAPNLFNPTEVVVRGTAYKLKATNASPTALISLPLSHTHTHTDLYLCLQQVIGCCSLFPCIFMSDFFQACCVKLKSGSAVYSARVLLSKGLWLPGFVAYLRCDSELPLSSVFVFTRCKS